MTNTTYFHNALREYYDSSSSASSSFSEQTPQPAEEVKVEAASSLYTTISNACLACARPLIKLDDDDNSTTINAMNSQPLRTDEKDTSQKLSSKFVSPISLCSTFKRCNFADLKASTRNFDPSAALKSSFGSVFKGWVNGHKLTATERGRGCIAVCVKVFNQGGFQDHTKFLERVNYFAHVEHPNLVRLLGYGLDGTHRVLVYEFTSLGSLEDHLFERSSQNFTSSLRMKVALDAAKGLAFIHSFPKKVIHGYIKPSNILVDSNYNAKLSGFELTKDRPTAFPEEVLDNGDSSYYINSANIHDAPEYRYEGRFSAKSDVFSFGVVFLEILCGQPEFEDYLRELTDIHSGQWIEYLQQLLQSKAVMVNSIHALNSLTAGQYSKNTVKMAIMLADKCLSIQAKLRPTMDEVVQALEELQLEER